MPKQRDGGTEWMMGRGKVLLGDSEMAADPHEVVGEVGHVEI